VATHRDAKGFRHLVALEKRPILLDCAAISTDAANNAVLAVQRQLPWNRSTLWVSRFARVYESPRAKFFFALSAP
jgi:hypothetical protein